MPGDGFFFVTKKTLLSTHAFQFSRFYFSLFFSSIGSEAPPPSVVLIKPATKPQKVFPAASPPRPGQGSFQLNQPPPTISVAFSVGEARRGSKDALQHFHTLEAAEGTLPPSLTPSPPIVTSKVSSVVKEEKGGRSQGASLLSGKNKCAEQS